MEMEPNSHEVMKFQGQLPTLVSSSWKPLGRNLQSGARQLPKVRHSTWVRSFDASILAEKMVEA